MNKEYRVVSSKKMTKMRNIVVEWNGWVFDIVYGKTSKGYFISVPNFNVTSVSSEPNDTIYNTGKIFRELNNVDMAKVISQAIKEDYEEWRKEN